MRAAVWVVGVWVGMAACIVLGWIFRSIAIRPCQKCREWRVLADELGDKVVDVRAELDRADYTIDMLRRNDGMAFLAGQMLQADREAGGL